MGVLLAEDYFGGSFRQAFTVNWTLGWAERQRLRICTVSSGLTITLPTAAECPDGAHIMVIVNADAADSFTLEDQGAVNVNLTLAINEAAIISKIGGKLRADKRELL